MKKNIAIVGLTLVAVIWGGGFVASNIALRSLTPLQIMTVRFSLTAFLMTGISVRSLRSITWRQVFSGSLMGVALFAGFALQIIGLQYTTASRNAFLTALNVVIVPFIAFVILRKRIGATTVIGAILSVAGVALLSLNGSFSLGLGDGLTLLCAVGFAFQIFLTGLYVRKYDAKVLNCIQMIVAFLLSAILMIARGETHFAVTTPGWLSVVYLGVISTTLCYLLQTECQKYVDETQAAIVLSMESVFGTLFSILFLHETMTIRMLLGCAVILAAVIISNFSENSREKSCGKSEETAQNPIRNQGGSHEI